MKYIVMAVITAVIAIVSVIWIECSRPSGPIVDVEVATNKNIAVTPTVIMSVRDIRQWEFVKITDEEVIDTVRPVAFWPDDRLVLIFHGTPRIGIDLTGVSDGWVVNHNDSLIVTLPQPQLLDSLFIDEALTEVFGQRGDWTGADRQRMYERARARMTARSLTPYNLEKARKAAADRFTAIFSSLGAVHVEVRFDDDVK